MCNFYARYRELRNLQVAFKFPEQPNDPPRYVVRPTDTKRVIAIGKDGRPAPCCADAPGSRAVVDVCEGGLRHLHLSERRVQQQPAFPEPWERGYRCYENGSSAG
jgi:hypothetical protein